MPPAHPPPCPSRPPLPQARSAGQEVRQDLGNMVNAPINAAKDVGKMSQARGSTPRPCLAWPYYELFQDDEEPARPSKEPVSYCNHSSAP